MGRFCLLGRVNGQRNHGSGWQTKGQLFRGEIGVIFMMSDDDALFLGNGLAREWGGDKWVSLNLDGD